MKKTAAKVKREEKVDEKGEKKRPRSLRADVSDVVPLSRPFSVSAVAVLDKKQSNREGMGGPPILLARAEEERRKKKGRNFADVHAEITWGKEGEEEEGTSSLPPFSLVGEGRGKKWGRRKRGRTSGRVGVAKKSFFSPTLLPLLLHFPVRFTSGVQRGMHSSLCSLPYLGPPLSLSSCPVTQI